MKYILTDIEGTTTSISFVHDVLFPYSKKNLKSFIEKNKNKDEIITILNQLTGSTEDKIEQLTNWIDQDKKEKPLKDLQGHIWQEGYLNGELKGHVYSEVKDQLIKWHELGITLGVYSSGSISAQKLLFQHSVDGNLDQYFKHNFDTSIGHKRDVQSYLNIINEIKISPNEILFLSDIKEELDAAKLAGMNTIQLCRNNLDESSNHQQVENFKQIKI
jgi:enolase-phosphatase E1